MPVKKWLQDWVERDSLQKLIMQVWLYQFVLSVKYSISKFLLILRYMPNTLNEHTHVIFPNLSSLMPEILKFYVAVIGLEA